MVVALKEIIMESSMPHIPMIGNNKKEEKEETEEEREARLAEEARIHEEEEARLKKLKVMSYFPKGKDHHWIYSCIYSLFDPQLVEPTCCVTDVSVLCSLFSVFWHGAVVWCIVYIIVPA